MVLTVSGHWSWCHRPHTLRRTTRIDPSIEKKVDGYEATKSTTWLHASPFVRYFTGCMWPVWHAHVDGWPRRRRRRSTIHWAQWRVGPANGSGSWSIPPGSLGFTGEVRPRREYVAGVVLQRRHDRGVPLFRIGLLESCRAAASWWGISRSYSICKQSRRSLKWALWFPMFNSILGEQKVRPIIGLDAELFSSRVL